MRQSFAKWREKLTPVYNHSISDSIFSDTVDVEALELLPYRPDEENNEHNPPSHDEQYRNHRMQMPRPKITTRILQLLQNFKPIGMRRFLDNNAGLLLVALSQAFFAVMNTSVKVLNSLDTPVSTLQLVFVRMVCRTIATNDYLLINHEAITYICGITYMFVINIHVEQRLMLPQAASKHKRPLDRTKGRASIARLQRIFWVCDRFFCQGFSYAILDSSACLVSITVLNTFLCPMLLSSPFWPLFAPP